MEKRFADNVALVGFVFHQKFNSYTSWQDDLIQEGLLALWKSCLNYEDSKGVSFGTYAYVAIYKSMLTYVNRYVDKHCVVTSLDDVISTTTTGEELRLMDVVPVVDDEVDVFYHLKECLRTMSLEDQYIIEKTMQGYTQKEIATQLGIAQSSVCRSLHKFKAVLEKE